MPDCDGPGERGSAGRRRLARLTRYATLSLVPRTTLHDGFYCPRKDAMIIEERYCRHVCDRLGVDCEHRKSKYAQHP